mgnify:CR=1 FL=1
MADKPRIGFIGLGLMGSAMVQRLLDLDYPMTIVANRSRPNVEAAVERGATEVASAKEVAAASDIIMLCMDTSANVESRMFGADGVIAGLSGGETIIDFGTSLPGSTKKIAAEVEAKGAHYMDCPLGRTPSHGRKGELNIMAGGAKADFDRMKPVLDDLGENVFHIGPLGAGHTVKLINNFFAMTTACAMSEAFAMADKAGLDRQTLYDAMSAGPLKSGMMDWIKAQAIDREIMLAFSVTNAGKDVGYYAQMAKDVGVDSMMSDCARTTLAKAKDDGWGDKMVPEMVDYFTEKFSG